MCMCLKINTIRVVACFHVAFASIDFQMNVYCNGCFRFWVLFFRSWCLLASESAFQNHQFF